MRPSKLVEKTYYKNDKNFGFSAMESNHTFEVNVTDWAIDEHHITFESDDFPYFRLALLDLYLERDCERV